MVLKSTMHSPDPSTCHSKPISVVDIVNKNQVGVLAPTVGANYKLILVPSVCHKTALLVFWPLKPEVSSKMLILT